MSGPRAVVLMALVLGPSVAWAQGMPLGPEFRVNAYVTDWQMRPQVASDAAGNFVVVWQSEGQDGYSGGIFGQRYDSSGTLLGSEFRVNTVTANNENIPRVASDAAGNFVVVWLSSTQGGLLSNVFGQRFSGTGAPLGPEFRVNTYMTGQHPSPSVASDPLGNFVVVWHSDTADGSGSGVLGQRFASSGAPLGPQFRVNSYTTGSQGFALAASDSAGNFVVVWTTSNPQDGSGYGVFGQRYQDSGAPLGPEFRVNTYTTNFQALGSLARDPSGNFVVVWNSFPQDGSSTGVFGQRFAGSGAPSGPEFRVNTYTTSYQSGPSVAADPSGNFVVVWASRGPDGSGDGVFAQRYASSGSPLDSEFRVNTYTTGYQQAWSVASDAAGNFVVVWQSLGQDGSGYGVYGQRYGPILPVELMHFGVE